MTDEAYFHLSGFVNKQNYRYWPPENPQEIHQHPLHSESLTVWCGIASFGVLGPYFFEDDEGEAVTVTSERYVAMLRTSVNQSYVVVGSISHQYGFSKMEQKPTQQGHQWVFCGKCFHNTSFPLAAMFHGLHFRLFSPPVITFYGGISKREFSFLSLKPQRNKAKHKGRKSGDSGADDSSGEGKSWSKTKAVFEKWWETSEWRTFQNLKCRVLSFPVITFT